MTNISNACQNYLDKNFTINYVKKETQLLSKDGTIKFLFRLIAKRKKNVIAAPLMKSSNFFENFIFTSYF